MTHVRAPFSNTKLALSTTLIIWVWAFIGLRFPLYRSFLPFIQTEKGAHFGDGSTYITYRDSLIIAVLGIPGALFGGLLVKLPRFGRKGALSLSAILTGVFLYLSTTTLSSNALLGWNRGYNLMSHVERVVCLYARESPYNKEPGNGECCDCDSKSYLRHHGAHHCNSGKPENIGSSLC